MKIFMSLGGYCVSFSKVPEYDELTAILANKAEGVLKSFREATVSGVGHSMISIISDINAYWEDVYRPALTSICCEAVGGRTDTLADVNLMIALLSAGGGIHDDIIDKSVRKNFRDTIYGLYGLDGALLAGDLLILKGWGKVQELMKKTAKPERIEEIISIFQNWTIEVLESEFMESRCRRNWFTEPEKENEDADLQYYQKILWKSTADMEACARIGAIVGGGTVEETNSLAKFGRHLGFGFRLADEVKDVFSVKANILHRLENESVPLPILYAAKSSKKNYLKTKTILENPVIVPSDIVKLLKMCLETNAFTYVSSIATENAKIAEDWLGSIKPSAAKMLLVQFAGKALSDIANLCP
jgi:geranylgeranyl pyrophosphate synthase